MAKEINKWNIQAEKTSEVAAPQPKKIEQCKDGLKLCNKSLHRAGKWY